MAGKTSNIVLVECKHGLLKLANCPSCHGSGWIQVIGVQGEPMKCKLCNGTGQSSQGQSCPGCNGTGWAGSIQDQPFDDASWIKAGDPGLPEPNPQAALDLVKKIVLESKKDKDAFWDSEMEVIYAKPAIVTIKPSQIKLGRFGFSFEDNNIDSNLIQQIKFGGKTHKFAGSRTESARSYKLE